MPPSLSVVIPYYAEPDWIGRVVADLHAAIERAPFPLREIVIVDDGSPADGSGALEALSDDARVKVVRQQNAGRFAARARGLEVTTGDLVLLIDSRISIRPDALGFVARELPRTGPAPVWTAHVDQDLAGNPFARLVHLMEYLAWRDYMAHPRTLSYGTVDFDRYPKGTTCFLAPRALLVDAINAFTSLYDDSREANDDTILIREIARSAPINISPGFSCEYRPRRRPGPFLRHTYHRGSVFLDGYGRRGTRFFGVIVGFFPASAAALAWAVRRPRPALLTAPALTAVAAAAAYLPRRSRADVGAVALVAPVWIVTYSLGMWRGLVLAAVRTVSRRGRGRAG